MASESDYVQDDKSGISDSDSEPGQGDEFVQEVKATPEEENEKFPDSEIDRAISGSQSESVRKSDKKRKSVPPTELKSKSAKTEAISSDEQSPVIKNSAKSFSISNILNNEKPPGKDADSAQKLFLQSNSSVPTAASAAVSSSFTNPPNPFATQFLPPTALSYWYPWLPFYQLDAVTLKQRNGKFIFPTF